MNKLTPIDPPFDISAFENPLWVDVLDKIIFFYPKTIDSIGITLGSMKLLTPSDLEGGWRHFKFSLGLVTLIITLYFAWKAYQNSKKHLIPIFGILTMWSIGAMMVFYTQSVIVCTQEEMVEFFGGKAALVNKGFEKKIETKPEIFENKKLLEQILIKK